MCTIVIYGVTALLFAACVAQPHALTHTLNTFALPQSIRVLRRLNNPAADSKEGGGEEPPEDEVETEAETTHRYGATC